MSRKSKGSSDIEARAIARCQQLGLALRKVYQSSDAEGYASPGFNPDIHFHFQIYVPRATDPDTGVIWAKEVKLANLEAEIEKAAVARAEANRRIAEKSTPPLPQSNQTGKVKIPRIPRRRPSRLR